MLKIGITGGIGSGKSIVCKLFEMLGVSVFYADDEAKKLYTTNETLKVKLIELFGKETYPNGIFNKEYLKNFIFQNSKKRIQLNELVHPLVLEQSEIWIEKHQNEPYILKEAALLIESKSYQHLDEIIFVEAPISKRIERVMKRDSLHQQEVKERMAAQLPDEEKKKYAQHIILNDEKHSLIEQVLFLHQLFLSKSKITS